MTDEYRSPSQLNEYTRCPHAYFLSRRARAWKIPAPWLAHGSAVHMAIEVWDQTGRTKSLEDVQEVFSEHYRELINLELKDNPNPAVWERSGPYRALEDIPRRHEVGKQHVANIIGWYEKNPDKRAWTDPKGLVWIEKSFQEKFGDVEVRGFIDVVIDEVPYDYKTGATPGGDEQLASYAGVLFLRFGIPFTDGFYFMAKNGKPTKAYDLRGWSIQRLADVYGELDQNIKAERFDPLPDPDKCSRCPVRRACEYAEV